MSQSSRMQGGLRSWGILVGGAVLAACAGGCGPIWLLDSGSAHRIAKEEHKPLLIYFKAWDSAQHRNMKLKVLEDPAVQRELVDTVNLEVEQAWALDDSKRYNVQKPQVCVFCTPDGDKVSILEVNPVPSEKVFLNWLQQSKMDVKSLTGRTPPATQPSRGAPPQP